MYRWLIAVLFLGLAGGQVAFVGTAPARGAGYGTVLPMDGSTPQPPPR